MYAGRVGVVTLALVIGCVASLAYWHHTTLQRQTEERQRKVFLRQAIILTERITLW